jgi:hypothetical protein
MSTPTQKALAVDRLAKAADTTVVPVQDYLFGMLPKTSTFIAPARNEGETSEDYLTRLDAARLEYREANPNVFGITHWDTTKLGPQPTDEQIEAEVLNPTISQAERIKEAEKHVLKWFTPLGVSALQDKLLEKKEAGTLDDYPKLVATYTWMKTIQATALAGSITFPDSPHTFDEVLAE